MLSFSAKMIDAGIVIIFDLVWELKSRGFCFNSFPTIYLVMVFLSDEVLSGHHFFLKPLLFGSKLLPIKAGKKYFRIDEESFECAFLRSRVADISRSCLQ